jgi:hypothetical protein
MFEMVGDCAPLFAALARAQGMFAEIIKNETADAGKYKYDYADLSVVLRAVRPALSACELCLMQPIDGGSADYGYSIRTILAHSSGAYISCRTLVPYEADPQQFGKRVTYQRRYGVLSFLSVFPAGEDDDAQGFSQQAEKHHPREQNPPKTQAPKATKPEAPKTAPANGSAGTTAPPVAEQKTGPTPDPRQVTSPDYRGETQAQRDQKQPESLLEPGPITRPMGLSDHEEGVKNNATFDPNGRMSDDQRKEIQGLTKSKCWPGTDGKPFREPDPKRVGENPPGERWATVNVTRGDQLAQHACGKPFSDVESFLDAGRLLGALRALPDRPVEPR